MMPVMVHLHFQDRCEVGWLLKGPTAARLLPRSERRSQLRRSMRKNVNTLLQALAVAISLCLASGSEFASPGRVSKITVDELVDWEAKQQALSPVPDLNTGTDVSAALSDQGRGLLASLWPLLNKAFAGRHVVSRSNADAAAAAAATTATTKPATTAAATTATTTTATTTTATTTATTQVAEYLEPLLKKELK